MPSSIALAPLGSLLTDALPVVWPLLAILAEAALLLRSLRKWSGRLDIFDLGAFYALLVTLYAVFPLASYLVNDLSFSLLSDLRLSQAQPSPKELAPIFWLYSLYLGAFALGYTRFRGTHDGNEWRMVRPPRCTLWALVLSLLLIKAFVLSINLIYGLGGAYTYNDTYLMYRGGPRFLQQILNHLGGMTLTLDILIMALLVFDFRKYRYWILGWVLTEILPIVFTGVGSRTGLFVLLMSFVACYHFTVKRLSVRTALVTGLGVLMLFVSLGIMRNLTEVNAGTELNPLGYSNEFEGTLANAYDISQRKAAGETQGVFPQFYVADVVSLIPQQLLPFKKIDLAAWYANTFYPTYAESGGGFAFGAIPEAILGLGWVDALWRGAAIGILFACVRRRFVRGTQTLWSYGFYLWVLIFAYECFRGRTFLLIPRAFYQFFLVFLWIPVFAQLLALIGSSNVSSIGRFTHENRESAASSRPPA